MKVQRQRSSYNEDKSVEDALKDVDESFDDNNLNNMFFKNNFEITNGSALNTLSAKLVFNDKLDKFVSPTSVFVNGFSEIIDRYFELHIITYC